MSGLTRRGTSQLSDYGVISRRPLRNEAANAAFQGNIELQIGNVPVRLLGVILTLLSKPDCHCQRSACQRRDPNKIHHHAARSAVGMRRDDDDKGGEQCCIRELKSRNRLEIRVLQGAILEVRPKPFCRKKVEGNDGYFATVTAA
ncbi:MULTISPECIES: hypothetical protein [Agrobacterium]|uniref:hypothetical protein n=1 Tax=Agrobacterium TaxID=357 RepID=UPI00236494DB|nr:MULTISPECIES: hypothetical protein [Agrobacterium]